jgi:RNA polymerase sigma-70 factor (ECF subfamily)
MDQQVQKFLRRSRKPFPEQEKSILGRSDAVPEKNQMSLDELFAPHMPRLYHVAAQVLRHPQDSEDALQEGLLAAFCHLNQFQGRAKFSTWLHSIVVRAALMKLRHRKREFTNASIDEEFENGDLSFERLIPDQRQNPEEEYSDIERSRILAEAMRKVPQRYRVVLQMCDVEGLMEKEAAQRLGTLVSVVKARRYRGRRMLLRHLRYTSLRRRRTENKGCPPSPGVEEAPGSCPTDRLMHTC